jgi:hypothetical protein
VRVLLDECMPRKLKNSLPGHECATAPEAGLAGKKNGELLSLAEKMGFDVFLTLDNREPLGPAGISEKTEKAVGEVDEWAVAVWWSFGGRRIGHTLAY